MHHFWSFKVRGSGRFPFRLLALDQCHPATSAEADAMITRSTYVAETLESDAFDVSDYHPPVEIRRERARFVTLHARTVDGPTLAAWEREGWPVDAASVEHSTLGGF